MMMIWKTNISLVLLYILIIGASEPMFLISLLFKFLQGGYFPLASEAVFVIILYIWNYGYHKNYTFEFENKVSDQKVKEKAPGPKISHLPGVVLFYTEIVQGISAIFTHYISNVLALHSILVFVSIKTLPTSKVPQEESNLQRKGFLRVGRSISRRLDNNEVVSNNEDETIMKGIHRNSQVWIHFTVAVLMRIDATMAYHEL
ncbi:Potassium transporter [Dillenia turbinata]|uniref:Potassium transporter n=1 Tax=Dillenia turbinata TaxID=194707 RepID=A0AAN8UH24_9MAGN